MEFNENKEQAKKNLAPLVEKIKGDRSIRKMAEDTGVAASYISGLINGKFIPSYDILVKLSTQNANPQNGVTQQDLMEAANYLTIETSQKRTPNKKVLTAYWESFEGMNDKGLAYENAAITVIRRTLDSKNIIVRNTRIKEVIGREYKPTVIFDLDNGAVDEWCFECLYIDKNMSFDEKWDMATYTIGRIVMQPPAHRRKVSIFTNDSDLYIKLADLHASGDIAYKGDLSVMYIEAEKNRITFEQLLSNSDDCELLRIAQHP